MRIPDSHLTETIIKDRSQCGSLKRVILIPTPELLDWFKCHLTYYHIRSLTLNCWVEIDDNDLEGRALLKLTWDIV